MFIPLFANQNETAENSIYKKIQENELLMIDFSTLFLFIVLKTNSLSMRFCIFPFNLNIMKNYEAEN